jgi:hypothetical protein
MDTDWNFIAPATTKDVIWYGTTLSDSSTICAATTNHDAIILADTEQELIALIESLDETLTADEIIPQPITWHSLSASWRWCVYQDQVRLMCGGLDWSAISLCETPDRESCLVCDPTTLALVAFRDGEPVTANGAIIVGADLMELLANIELAGMPVEDYANRETEFKLFPLVQIASDDNKVWLRGQTYDVRKALEKNHAFCEAMMNREMNNEN